MANEQPLRDGVTAAWAEEVLDFWFKELGEQGWWNASAKIDAACAARFGQLWTEKQREPATAFLARAEEALAGIILFDQLPRNMFRHQARAFATDALAREIARGALSMSYDIQLSGDGRMFFYMPFQHSEAIEDQALSLELFGRLGDADALDFARKHEAVIARFGRFPHRNAALGRETRPEEREAESLGRDW